MQKKFVVAAAVVLIVLVVLFGAHHVDLHSLFVLLHG